MSGTYTTVNPSQIIRYGGLYMPISKLIVTKAFEAGLVEQVDDDEYGKIWIVKKAPVNT